jgi:cell division control protein 45
LPEDVVQESESEEDVGTEDLSDKEAEDEKAKAANTQEPNNVQQASEAGEANEGEKEPKKPAEEEEKRKPGKRTNEERLEARKIRRYRRMKFESYYSGSFFGKSVAHIIYSISQQLNKENLEYAWMWVIGLTYQYIHSRVSRLQYDESVVELQREISRLNKQKDVKKQDKERINREVGTIDQSQEYLSPFINAYRLRFMLLRHWTLFDSAYYSNYIATKFEIWKVFHWVEIDD